MPHSHAKLVSDVDYDRFVVWIGRNMFHWGDRSEPNLIVEGLYLGNGRHGSSITTLEHLKITHIVNVTPYLSRNLPQTIKVLHIDIHDYPTVDVSVHFDNVFKFIDEGVKDNESRVLVHCEMGMSRSSTMVIMYLMKAFGLSLREALCLTRLRRPITNPNNGFMRHLAELEHSLFGAHSVDVGLFRDPYGSGSMQVESPEEWKLKPPGTLRHPERSTESSPPTATEETRLSARATTDEEPDVV